MPEPPVALLITYRFEVYEAPEFKSCDGIETDEV